MILSLLLFSGTVLASESTEAQKADEGALYGQTRFVASHLSDFAVDAEGTKIGQTAWFDARARVGATMPFFLGTLDTEWEINAPQLFGDMWTIPGIEDERQRDARILQILPRKLSITTQAGPYQVSAGLTTSHWGLGLLANDGAHPDWWGRSDFGDRVIRLRATRLPFSSKAPHRAELFTTAAIDLVVADDLGRLDAGQIAGQGILSALWRHKDRGQWGAYVVLRHQRERDRSRQTTALATDAFAQLNWSVGSWTLETSGEAALLLGNTNRATTYTSRTGQNVAQFGATGLVALHAPEKRFTARLRAAYGTGDGQPDNGVASNFLFDRDFSAGMILFDQFKGGVEAAAYQQLIDPDVSGQPPDGAEALVTEGAFQSASFVQPAIAFSPISWGQARLGATLIWSTAPMSQPFYTYRAGGSPRNHLNAPVDGNYLGTEINWSVTFMNMADTSARSAMLDLQFGHLFTGNPIQAGGGPQRIHHAMAIVRTEW